MSFAVIQGAYYGLRYAYRMQRTRLIAELAKRERLRHALERIEVPQGATIIESSSYGFDFDQQEIVYVENHRVTVKL